MPGREQGEWVWVRNKRMKALGPEQDGRNGHRQGNGHGGKDSSLGQQVYQQEREQFSSRPASREKVCGAISRVTVLHENERGRSPSYRHGRPFSCSHEIVVQEHDSPSGYHGKPLIRVGNDNIKNIRVVNNAVHGYDNNINMNQVTAVFYITNFPDHFLFVNLKKGLEVCGILSDIYLSRFHNVHGQRFGFAKFLKVRDVEKLKKALNNVFFWDLRLFANVAKYDRFVEVVDGSVGGVAREFPSRLEGEKKKEWKEGKNKREVKGK